MRFHIFLFFIILSTALVSAQSVNIVKDSHISGETVQAYIQHPSFTVAKLELVDNHSQKIGVSFFTKEISNNSYFIYFDLPTTLNPGIVSLQVKEKGWVNGILQDIIYSDNSTIISNFNSLSFRPGIIELDKDKSTFNVKLSNKGNQALKASVDLSDKALVPARKTFDIAVGESKNIFVNYDFNLVKGDAQLTITYNNRVFTVPILKPTVKIPIIVQKNKTVINKTSPKIVKTKVSLKFIPDVKKISHRVAASTMINGSLGIINPTLIDVHNVSVSVSTSLERLIDFNVTKFNTIKVNETKHLYIWINKQKKAQGYYSGEIVVGGPDINTLKIPINLAFEQTQMVPNKTPIISISQGLNISDIDPNLTLPGNYTKKKKDTGKYGIVGILILLILLVLVGYLAYKLRPQNAKKEFKEYTSKFKRGKNRKGY